MYVVLQEASLIPFFCVSLSHGETRQHVSPHWFA